MFTDTSTSICLNAISGMTLTPVTTSEFVVMTDLLAQPVLARRGSARHWLLQAGAAAQLAAAISARAPREFMIISVAFTAQDLPPRPVCRVFCQDRLRK